MILCRCGRPTCRRRCIGTITQKYKLYENCSYSLVKVCSCCGHEYDFRRYPMCPSCGAQMDDPPGDPPRGGSGRFGGGFGYGFGFGHGFGGFWPWFWFLDNNDWD